MRDGVPDRRERTGGVWPCQQSAALCLNCSGGAPVSACMLSHAVVLDSAKSPPGSSVHGILQVGEYWSGLPFPSPGDLLHPRREPPSPASAAQAGKFFITEPPTRIQKDLTRFDARLAIQKMQLHKFEGAELDLVGVLRITTGDFVDCMPEIGPPKWCVGLP